MSLQCCRAILISPSVNLRMESLERSLNIILWQHICFANCCFEGQPFACTAFASFPVCQAVHGYFLIVISEVAIEMKARLSMIADEVVMMRH